MKITYTEKNKAELKKIHEQNFEFYILSANFRLIG